MKIGGRGDVIFKGGYYIYVGSALNSLESRIRRHLSRDKRLFWHVDYFLERAELIDILYIETKEKIECKVSEKLTRDFDYIQDFGSSDCTCPSHLFYSRKNPVKRIREMGFTTLKL